MKKTLAIPLSAFPPVTLARPLNLFGRTFKVFISTGITLSPTTVLQSSIDMSLSQFIRSAGGVTDMILKDFMRGASGTNELKKETRENIEKLFGKHVPADSLACALRGDDSNLEIPWKSDWAALLAGLSEPGQDDFYQLVARLAELDAVVMLKRQDAVVALELLFDGT
ncbi:MAG: hypothetical protein ABI606_11315, partial [Rhodoferax sp.]